MYSIIYDKEFIAEAHDADLKREYFAKGEAKGKAEGIQDAIRKLVATGKLSSKDAEDFMKSQPKYSQH